MILLWCPRSVLVLCFDLSRATFLKEVAMTRLKCSGTNVSLVSMENQVREKKETATTSNFA